MTVVMRRKLAKYAGAGVLILWHCLAFAAAPAGGSRPAEDLFLRLGGVGLDPGKVNHVREAHIDRPGFSLTLDDGTIGFTEDVLGRVTGALFEGEGEILALPPDRAERSSLALFTGSAVLEERFSFAYIRFNDGTFEELQPYLTPAADATEFLSKWSGEAKELASSDALRLLTTFSKLLPPAETPRKDGPDAVPDRMLHARIHGVKLGTFDLLYDSLALEPVQVLQLGRAGGNDYYDMWMSFNPKSAAGKVARAKEVGDAFAVNQYRIQARVAPPRRLEAETTCEVRVLRDGQRAILFELSRYLLVTRVEAAGHALEFIHNPAFTGSELARRGNDLIAVIFPQTLNAGDQVTLKFAYGGEVLEEEANGLLSVGARGTWYPNRGLQMANFDLEFSYPTGWTLLATGARAGSSATDLSAEEVHSRWISTRPIPVAGFNLGRYIKATAMAGDALVEAYATVEMGLTAPKVAPGLASQSARPIAQTSRMPSPAQNVQVVADRAAAAVTFFAGRFGPYPYGTLALTQAPGPVSQGWPGLVFLSGYAFLSPEELDAQKLRPADVILAHQTPAHETAHQWWGDLVMWKTYRDQWISEGLASYCALLELEDKDPVAFRVALDSYRDDLVRLRDKGSLASPGAVTLGLRLNSSRFPAGYDLVAYGRGAWLFHMLREMLRDDARLQPHGAGGPDKLFTQILRGVQERYAGRALSTRELLQAFEEHWPKSLWFEGKPSLDWFWDSWIQGTSVPVIELKGVKVLHQKDGLWADGSLVQRDAPDDLIVPVPLYAEGMGKAPVFLGRVFADGVDTRFRLRVPPGTRRLLLDPGETLLRQR